MSHFKNCYTNLGSVTGTKYCLQRRLLCTYWYNHMFRESPNLNKKSEFSFFFKFLEVVLNFLFCFSKSQFTSHQPISVTDFGWSYHVKRLISLCQQNLWLRSVLFWDVTQRRVDCWTREGGTGIGSLETSVANCQSALCKILEEGRAHLHCDRSLTSRKTCFFFKCQFEEGGGCIAPWVRAWLKLLLDIS
jgi:hypothetical protein